MSGVVFNKLFECSQRLAAVYRLASNIYAFFYALLAFLQHLYAEGSVGQYDVLLGGQGSVFKHGVEYVGRFLLCGACYQLFGFGRFKAQVGGLNTFS